MLSLFRQSWALKTWVSIVYLQFEFDEIQNDDLTGTLVFLAGAELKKNYYWEDWNLF